MPTPIIKAFGILKKASAIVNVNFGLDPKKGILQFRKRTPLFKLHKK